jgi:hypothetical protein
LSVVISTCTDSAGAALSNCIVTPGIAVVTVFEELVVGTPSTLSPASCPFCTSPKAIPVLLLVVSASAVPSIVTLPPAPLVSLISASCDPDEPATTVAVTP